MPATAACSGSRPGLDLVLLVVLNKMTDLLPVIYDGLMSLSGCARANNPVQLVILRGRSCLEGVNSRTAPAMDRSKLIKSLTRAGNFLQVPGDHN